MERIDISRPWLTGYMEGRRDEQIAQAAARAEIWARWLLCGCLPWLTAIVTSNDWQPPRATG